MSKMAFDTRELPEITVYRTSRPSEGDLTLTYDVAVQDKCYFEARSEDEIGERLAGIIDNLNNYKIVIYYSGGPDTIVVLEDEYQARGKNKIRDAFETERVGIRV